MEMTTNYNYRYPGSRPFEDNTHDRLLFKGREREQIALLHTLLTENLVILYAQSGIGKTSLLNAGLMQPLRQKGFIPLVIRFINPGMDCLQAIHAGIGQTARLNGIEHTPGEEATLWQYFKTAEFWSFDDTLLIPVLIFDQFEEVFASHHGPEDRKAFFTQLADLVRNRIPREVQESLKPGEEYPYSETPPNVKIIISIREDFLGELEEMSREIPEIFSNRYRLVSLNREQARKAIEEPARLRDESIKSRSFAYDPRAIDVMLDFLCARTIDGKTVNTDEVMPFQLQLLCRDIETRLGEIPDAAGTEVTVQESDLGGVTGMQRVMQDFYDNRIKQLASPLQRMRAHSLFEDGLLIGDRRLKLDEDVITTRFKVSKSLLNDLVDSRLLLRSESRDHAVNYELSHDTLIKPIRVSQRKRNRLKRAIYCVVCLCVIVIIIQTTIKLRVGEIVNGILASSNQKLQTDSLTQQGNQLIEKQRNNDAIELLQNAITIDPDNASAHFYLGDAYSNLGDDEKATENYRKAIQLAQEKPKKNWDFDYIACNISMGNIFAKQGNIEEACRYYREAIRLAPGKSNCAPAYTNLGNILADQKNYTEAVNNYRKAVQIRPDYSDAYYGLGYVSDKHGEYDDAVKKYKLAIKYNPKNAVAVEKLKIAEINLRKVAGRANP